MTSFRIDYYDQNGVYVIAQVWDATNIALALGSGGKIAAGTSKDWAVNWNTNAVVTSVRAAFQGTATDEAGNAVTVQGSQTVAMPAVSASR
jgi:hypothetical protein